jgi:hypothetical protein
MFCFYLSKGILFKANDLNNQINYMLELVY